MLRKKIPQVVAALAVTHQKVGRSNLGTPHTLGNGEIALNVVGRPNALPTLPHQNTRDVVASMKTAITTRIARMAPVHPPLIVDTENSLGTKQF